MTPTAASTRMARSSQVRSTERRAGVSMVDVVIDDMAIGNPASPMAQRWRFWASFPGIHIAQFSFRVIEKYGLIGPLRCSNPGNYQLEVNGCHRRRWAKIRAWTLDLGWGRRFSAGTSPAIAGWRCTQYDGIVAATAVRFFSAAGVG